MEQAAIVKIEMAALDAVTQIVTAGLTSEAARKFLLDLPSVESLMPALSYQAVAGDADPPIVEQLITPNALRQRRFRERQHALHNGQPALHNGGVTRPDDEPETQ